MDETESRISRALQAEGIYSPEMMAYAMATIQHETAGTMQPIREYGGAQQAVKNGYSGGQNYYGRGYIQLTHDYNYRQIGQRIGVGDALLKNPDLALDPEMSAKILAAFFKDRGVAQKVQQGNFVGARNPINPDNKGKSIANQANQYLKKYKNITQPNTDTIQPNLTPTQQYSSGTVTKTQNSSIPTGTNTPLFNQTGRSGAMNSYVVRPGDTLSGIAQKYLGSANLYSRLSGYSSGNVNKIYPGETIRWA